MLGVLIVDDEALSRVELKAMIDWEREGFFILGEAENGKNGLELILKEKPDIVVTDVKMPIMDGLEMIRQANESYSDARYIVLSSYEEFGLLKTAMNYGVADYLLKLEFTPMTLLRTLIKQKNELLKEKDSMRCREVSPALHTAQILRNVLNGKSSYEAVASVIKQVNSNISVNSLSCVAVKISVSGKAEKENGSDLRTLETAAHSIINDISKRYFPGITFLTGTGLCLFLFSPNKEEYKKKIQEMSEVFMNMIRQYLNVSSVVGVASFETGIRDVKKLMEVAISAIDKAFFEGYMKVFYSTRIPKKENTGIALSYHWADSFTRALELRDEGELVKIFEMMQQKLNISDGITRHEAYNLCFFVVSLTLSVFQKISEKKEVFGEKIYETIGGIDTLEGLQNWLFEFESKVLDILTTSPEKGKEDYIVNTAKRIIQEKCDQSINLNLVAKELSISPGYLSSLFKQKANIGFVEYVTKCKMSKAKNLLVSGKYKIYEVSNMLGYEDSSYFIKIFHKMTGFTPREYIAHHVK